MQAVSFTNFKCFDCDFGSSVEADLARHCHATVHRQRWLCLPCMAVFASEDELDQHRQVVDVPAHRYCNPCNILFSTLRLFARHRLKEHKVQLLVWSSKDEKMEARHTNTLPEAACHDVSPQGDEKPKEAEKKEQDFNTATEREKRGLRSVGSFEFHLRYGSVPFPSQDRSFATSSVIEEEYEPPVGYQDHIGSSTPGYSIAWTPEHEPLQPQVKDADSDTPHRRHCSLCNIYFESVSRFEKHKFEAHTMTQIGTGVRESLTLTCHFRREQVEILKEMIDSAEREEFELLWRHEQLEDLESEETRRGQLVHSQEDCPERVTSAKEVVEQKKKNRTERRVTRSRVSNLKISNGFRKGSKLPSIQILAVMAFSNMDSLVWTKSPTYCPICRHLFKTVLRCEKHKAKVHPNMQEAQSKMRAKARRAQNKTSEKIVTDLKHRPACACSNPTRPSFPIVKESAAPPRAGVRVSEWSPAWIKTNIQKPTLLKGLDRTERQSRKRDKGRWGDERKEEREWYREEQQIKHRKEREGGRKWRSNAGGLWASKGWLRDEMRRERKRKPKRVVRLTESVTVPSRGIGEYGGYYDPEPWWMFYLI